MKKPGRNSGIWNYLNQLGLLEKGSEEDIKKAKKDFWRNYDKEYKRKKRKQKREYIVSFTPHDTRNILETAKAKGMKVPEYIRQATKADMMNTHVTPYPHTLKEIEQILLSYKRIIKDIAGKDRKTFLGINRNYESLEQVITKLESYIIGLFREAPPLEKFIEDTLRVNPQFITTLNYLIQHYDRKELNSKDKHMASAT